MIGHVVIRLISLGASHPNCWQAFILHQLSSAREKEHTWKSSQFATRRKLHRPNLHSTTNSKVGTRSIDPRFSSWSEIGVGLSWSHNSVKIVPEEFYSLYSNSRSRVLACDGHSVEMVCVKVALLSFLFNFVIKMFTEVASSFCENDNFAICDTCLFSSVVWLTRRVCLRCTPHVQITNAVAGLNQLKAEPFSDREATGWGGRV